MIRYERAGRWVDVGVRRERWHGGTPCYEVDLEGDVALFIEPSAAVEWVYALPLATGGVRVGYRPTTAAFATSSEALIALGRWGT